MMTVLVGPCAPTSVVHNRTRLLRDARGQHRTEGASVPTFHERAPIGGRVREKGGAGPASPHLRPVTEKSLDDLRPSTTAQALSPTCLGWAPPSSENTPLGATHHVSSTRDGAT